jgi:hypothetical protein
MAEEVGVEPTKHFNSISMALKAMHPTRDVALPHFQIADNTILSFSFHLPSFASISQLLKC